MLGEGGDGVLCRGLCGEHRNYIVIIFTPYLLVEDIAVDPSAY